MKLQRFIENYRNDKGDRTHSSDRSGVFRTSESIGTLNSRDEFATDRSFAIKEIPIYQNSHKRDNTHEVDMLKQICVSERPPMAKVADNGPITAVEEFSCEPLAECLPTVEAFSTTFSKPKKSNLMRPHFSFRPEQLQERNDDLYEEAPSQMECRGEDRLRWLVRHQEQMFLGQLEALTQRVQHLQAENLELEEMWLSEEQLSLKYQRACSLLEEQVTTLKETVTSTIQQNIEIENMIKEVLLKQEMQKYHCFIKQDSRKVKGEDYPRVKPIL